MKKKVIIDTDPGIDDALALIFAFKHPDIEILGITSAAGNKGLETTTNNATRILNHFNQEVLVYKGEEITYTESVNENFKVDLDFDEHTTHGEDGLGSIDIEKNDDLIADIDAVTFILETVKKYPGEVDIITLGPLTNIAYCIEKDQETMEKVKSIHSMGGGVFKGNMTPVAEFNYWFDPESVNKVFSLGSKVPIHMIGLDVTHQAIIDVNDFTFMKLIDPELGSLINEMVQDYIQSYWENRQLIGAVIHDLTAVVGYVYPEIYSDVYHANLRCVVDNEIALGQCVVDLVDSWKLEKNAYIPMKINVELYKKNIIETMFGTEASKLYEKIQ